jgi:hypothetical protein
VSAEARHAASPDTFELPSAEVRNGLRKGDAASLLFDIESREPQRMWVVVTDFEDERYVGLLISDPGALEGINLMLGKELAFGAEHICRVDRPPEAFLTAQFGAGFLSES